MGARLHSEIEIAADDPAKTRDGFCLPEALTPPCRPIAKSIKGWDAADEVSHERSERFAQVRNAPQPVRRRELIDVAMGKAPAETIVQGGRLVNVATAEIYPADVAIKGGRIAAVGDVAYTKGPSTRIIDATGRFITPAWLKATCTSITAISASPKIC